MVARKLGQESELGKQLDSMSDIITFAAGPALFIYEVLVDGMWYRKLPMEIHSNFMEVFSPLSRK